ncbi:type-2 ice-structuring protein-like [Pempheris klunzingeri]|uniref:type-2 ice-structuring protein-like n=1 Tax=Pempheris klunzingeri TaxID=3127111 RepID=UPI00397F4E7C
MKMLMVSVLLLCAMMPLIRAAALQDAEVKEEHKARIVKRSTCPSGWVAYSGRCFTYFPRQMSWAKAEKNCQSMGGNLASVHNVQEYHEIQRLIVSITYDYKPTWIGGSDAQEEGVWLWSDGTLFQYKNWCPGEPNNYHSQHCTQMNFGATKCWDDLSCGAHLPSVCAKMLR